MTFTSVLEIIIIYEEVKMQNKENMIYKTNSIQDTKEKKKIRKEAKYTTQETQYIGEKNLEKILNKNTEN